MGIIEAHKKYWQESTGNPMVPMKDQVLWAVLLYPLFIPQYLMRDK